MEEISYSYQALHNPTNKLITHEDLLDIFKRANIVDAFMEKNVNIYEFDLSIFQKAFTHISYTEDRKKKFVSNVVEIEDEGVNVNLCVPIQKESSERIEWFGDAIIQSVVTTYLWNRFPGQSEGFYTTNRSKLVKTEPLGMMGIYLGFPKYILLSKYQEDKCNGRYNLKNLEDCFEAFTGALYEVTGEKFNYDFVTKFIINCIETKIDIPLLIMYNDNYKHILMELYQKKFSRHPEYAEVKIEDKPTGKGKLYTMCVKDIYGNEFAYGKSSSKKEAEKLAAKEACKSFGLKVSEESDYYLKTIYES